MRVTSISLRNFRNHRSTDISFKKPIVVLHGLNGAGKTSVLEAIAIASVSKSFLPTSDSLLIRAGANEYQISVHAEMDSGATYNVGISFELNSRKRIAGTLGENLYPKEMIGIFPSVVLSPDYKDITSGSPGDRRRFLDTVLSQESRVYMGNVLALRHTLKQRNALLNGLKTGQNRDDSSLSFWTEELIVKSAEVVARRARFIEEFVPIFLREYQSITQSEELAQIEYQPDTLFPINQEFMSVEQNIECYRSEAQIIISQELRRGMTIFGAQKDELSIKLNGGEARDICSQGQHKSLLIALKLAEFKFLSEVCDQTPVFLLDDLFSELDSRRTRFVLDTVLRMNAQVFISTTETAKIEENLPSEFSSSDVVDYFEVRDGEVVRQ